MSLVTFGVRSASKSWNLISKGMLVMAVFPLGRLPAPVSAQQHIGPTWSIGVLGEYTSVGGPQFGNVGDGVGLNLYVNRRMNATFTVSVGVSASFYRVPRGGLDGFASTSTTAIEALGTLYARPTLHLRPITAGVIPYVGAQVGLVGGDFRTAFYGLQGGSFGGLVFPIGHRLDLDLGVTASMIHVGPFQHISRGLNKWGRMLVLRSGVAVRLGRS